MLFRHLKTQLQVKTFQHLFNCQLTTAAGTLLFESQTCQPKTTDCFLFYIHFNNDGFITRVVSGPRKLV